MRHIDVLWYNAGPDTPFRLVSEVDERGLEIRKLEFFRSGAVGSASAVHETSDTRLGTAPVPSLKEIVADQLFSGQEIPASEFEHLWDLYGRALYPYEVVQLVATVPEVPPSLVGAHASVLVVHGGSRPPAYEIEFVESDATNIWYGTVLREFLCTVQPSIA